MKSFFRQAFLVAAKDLRTELRNREVMQAALAFALVVLLLFSFSFDPITNPEIRDLGGGLLWLVFLFAGILILNRSFARESANDCIEALVASPLTGSALFAGKAFANWMMLMVLEAVSLPIFFVFWDVRWPESLLGLALVFALGTLGFAVVGTVFSAVTASHRLRELMLPLLVFPLILPAMMACVELTTVLLAGERLDLGSVWVRLLIGFDVVFALLGSLLLEAILIN